LFEMKNGFVAIGPATPGLVAGHTANIGDEGWEAKFGEVYAFGKGDGVRFGRWWNDGGWRRDRRYRGRRNLRLFIGLPVAAGGDSHDNAKQGGEQ